MSVPGSSDTRTGKSFGGRASASSGAVAFYRKRPVVIKAMQLLSYEHSGWKGWAAVTKFFGSKSGEGVWRAVGMSVYISTLEGEMQALPGDWIIRGVAGEFYPCKPDIFAATYEPAGDDTTALPPTLEASE